MQNIGIPLGALKFRIHTHTHVAFMALPFGLGMSSPWSRCEQVRKEQVLHLSCSRVGRNARAQVLFLCVAFSPGLLKSQLFAHTVLTTWSTVTCETNSSQIFTWDPTFRQPCSGVASGKQWCVCWIPFPGSDTDRNFKVSVPKPGGALQLSH